MRINLCFVCFFLLSQKYYAILGRVLEKQRAIGPKLSIVKNTYIYMDGIGLFTGVQSMHLNQLYIPIAIDKSVYRGHLFYLFYQFYT